MTVRRPLKLDGTGIKEMTDAEIEKIVNKTMYLYGSNPSSTLTVGSADTGGTDLGTLNSMVDTIQRAGASTSGDGNENADPDDDYATEAATPNASPANLATYELMYGMHKTAATLADSDNLRFPIYFYTSGNPTIQSFTVADFNDTFITPAINKLVDGTDRPGVYKIHTAETLSGHTKIGTVPVFKDHRQDTTLFTAAGIPEAVDQTTVINNYWLMRKDADSDVSYTAPMKINKPNEMIEYSTADFNAILTEGVRAHRSGNRIYYQVEDSAGFGNGFVRGSTMTDTRLDGSNYQTRKDTGAAGDSDDLYLTQEFPSGTAQTIKQYYLRVYKA